MDDSHNSCVTNNIVPITIVQQCDVPSPTNTTGSFLQSILVRLQQRDVIVVYAIVIVVWLLFFLSYIPGIYSQWFLNLEKPLINLWIPRIAWIVAALLSYIGSYILARSIPLDKYLAIVMLYVSGSFIMLGWSVALYQARNIALAAWIAGVLFIYQAALFLLVWHLNPIAAIFMIPILALYLYLVYSTVELAALNNVLL
jgi:tryptophan-rich sensory protein